jgi:small subunit ribosomal protein S9
MATPKPKLAYIEGLGRRKTSVARVRISEATKTAMTVNDRPLDNYFPAGIREITLQPLAVVDIAEKFSITVLVKGGGQHSQAEAVRHGLSRAILKRTPETKPSLKKAGFLTRDSRTVERKHFGLKKARKASQWSKR